MHRMLMHLHRIQKDNIVIISSSDSSWNKGVDLDDNIWYYFKNELGVRFMDWVDYSIAHRDSFLLIGRAGAKVQEPWMNVVKKKRYEGPILYSTRIKLNPVCKSE